MLDVKIHSFHGLLVWVRKEELKLQFFPHKSKAAQTTSFTEPRKNTLTTMKLSKGDIQNQMHVG